MSLTLAEVLVSWFSQEHPPTNCDDQLGGGTSHPLVLVHRLLCSVLVLAPAPIGLLVFALRLVGDASICFQGSLGFLHKMCCFYHNALVSRRGHLEPRRDSRKHSGERTPEDLWRTISRIAGDVLVMLGDWAEATSTARGPLPHVDREIPLALRLPGRALKIVIALLSSSPARYMAMACWYQPIGGHVVCARV